MLVPGNKAPDLHLPLTIDAQFDLADQTPELFTMLVFYRGKHCPICRSYLETIGGRLDEITKRGINPLAISMDSEERAMVVDREWDTHDLPLAHSMSEETAREWSLYISSKREGSDEPPIFSEPALYLIKPDGTIYFANVQSAPFMRPPIDELLKALDFIGDKNYPPRGMAT